MPNSFASKYIVCQEITLQGQRFVDATCVLFEHPVPDLVPHSCYNKVPGKAFYLILELGCGKISVVRH